MANDGTPLPSALTGNIEERVIRLDSALFYLVNGALAYLLDNEPLEQTGALTVENARSALSAMFYVYLWEAVTTVPIGGMIEWPSDTIPDRWLLCDGASLLRADYPELFAIIGVAFGSVDSTHFNVPQMENRSPMGAHGATVPDIADTWGATTHNMLLNDLVPHSHAVTDPGHSHAERLGSNLPAYVGAAGSGGFAISGQANNTATRLNTDSQTTGISIGTAGSGNPFNIVHPVLGLNYIIFAGR